jgi:anti-anti-sigma factor
MGAGIHVSTSVSEALSLTADVRRTGHTVMVHLRGEADIATSAYLEAALTSCPADGATSVHIDISDLEFCGVAPLHQLVVFAQAMRQGGREVVTCGAHPVVRRLAHLMGATATLGLC